MSRLTRKDILHIAKLARLSLTYKEVNKYYKQLSSVVDYMGELAQVDTSEIEPTSQTTGLIDVTRQDKLNPDDCLSQKDALSGISRLGVINKTNKGYFVVNAILQDKKVSNS